MTDVGIPLGYMDSISAGFTPSYTLIPSRELRQPDYRSITSPKGIQTNSHRIPPHKQIRTMKFASPDAIAKITGPILRGTQGSGALPTIADTSGFNRLISLTALPHISEIMSHADTITDPSLRLVFSALAFAAEQHKTQCRKNENQTPYIVHPIRVARRLWIGGKVRDAFTLAAAILHDTIEDTRTTETDLNLLFGGDITAIVNEVTDPPLTSWQECRRLQEENAPYMSPPAKQIKISDKSDNISDVRTSPPTGWNIDHRREYIRHAKRVVDAACGTNPSLERHFDKEYRACSLLLFP